MTIDHAQLLAEIEDEVRRKRESGELPAGLERELDLVFARFAPVHALEGDFAQVLTRAEEATFIDVLAPFESSLPVVPYVKRVIRKLILWVVRYVAQQVSGFAQAITRAVRLLGERVDALEDALPAAVAEPADGRTAIPDLDHWSAALTRLLDPGVGRVLHAEAGDGALVERLLAAGFDAYGTEPSSRASLVASAKGLEIRTDGAREHLEVLPDRSLGGVVLSGCVDRLPVAAQLSLAGLAFAKVAPGGMVAVVATDPVAWAADRSAVEHDLAPGRPLRAETWRHVLAEQGFLAVELHAGPRPPGLEAVPAGRRDPAAAVLNANIERLNEVLFPPTSYAVSATRP